jgi:hypothetical protein
VWGGTKVVINVAELTVKLVASVPPNVTLVAPLKPVPVIRTTSPPLVLPDVTERLVIAGTAAAT